MTKSPPTKTEKLREQINDSICGWCIADECPDLTSAYTIYCEENKTHSAQILKVCKEAGLKFVPPEWKMDNLCYASDRDAGVRDSTKQAMNSQVKPIEVE